MPAAAKVFHGAAIVLFTLALAFFADALGAPVYRRIVAATAWMMTGLFVGLAMAALFFAFLAEELARITGRLDRIEHALGRGARPAAGKDVSGING